ncbi:hypothetical protein BKA70DRAFT_1408218 [Coprinopsis sp. MPI-PUGE-AT-0042]|nr:hypothetical protein BKA70DRAFT_1408218 [Coprinopsis sp. MPI-PUGE-AT-0042]
MVSAHSRLEGVNGGPTPVCQETPPSLYSGTPLLKFLAWFLLGYEAIRLVRTAPPTTEHNARSVNGRPMGPVERPLWNINGEVIPNPKTWQNALLHYAARGEESGTTSGPCHPFDTSGSLGMLVASTVRSDWKSRLGNDSHPSSIASPKQASRRIPPVIVDNAKRPKDFTIFIQKLSGESVVVEVNKWTSIMDVHHWLWKVEDIHPDQQRLTWEGKPMDQGRRMGELGVRKQNTLQLVRVLPGAYVSTIVTWKGEITGHECGLPILRFRKGALLVAHKLVHVDWLFCTNEEGRSGLVPRTHVAVLDIFKQSLYDELKSTTLAEGNLPAVSQPPAAVRRLKVYPLKQPLWRRFTRRLEGRKGGAKRLESLTRRRQYLDPWDRSLQSRYLQEARKYVQARTPSSIGTPTLPPLRLNPSMTKDSASPAIDAESSLFLRHGKEDLRRASVVLDISLCHLTSREDIPMIVASVKCASYESERITSVCISFKPHGDNKVLDLWPRDVSGPIKEVNTMTKESTLGKAHLNASIVADPMQFGGGVEQERGEEIERNFIVQTQVSIKGWIEGTKARWDLTDDEGKKGLQTETALCMRVRYKPREMKYKYAITILKDGSPHEHRGATKLLFP